MSKGPQTFRQIDVTRAIKAAVKAGVTVSRVEITADRIVIVAATNDVTTAPSLADDLDQELADFEARHGQD